MIKYYGNGKVFTGRDETHFVSAFGVEYGRFVWVGETGDIPGEYEDLQGKTVVPGFIDSHMHPIITAKLANGVALMPPKVYSIEDMVREMKHLAERTPAGQWIDGWGWDELQFAERRVPTRQDLDRISTEHPIKITRSCMHSVVVNTYALEKMGVTADTPDPENGKIVREDNGTPTGYLMEEASRFILVGDDDSSDAVADLAKISQRFAKYGITTVTDMATQIAPKDAFDTYKEASKKGFDQRVSLYYLFRNVEEHPDVSLQLDNADEKVRVAGFKLLTDGAMSSQTAFMKEPYPDSDTYGFPVEDGDDIRRGLALAKQYGLQLSVHAIGDAAVQLVIDSVKEEEPWLQGAPSVRMEHATLLDDAMIGEIKSAKLGVSTQMIFLYAEYDSYRANLDDERLNRCNPLRTFVEELDEVALNSDCPSTPWAEAEDVFVSLQSAVRRINPAGNEYNRSQEITVPQAVLLYTRNAARMINRQDIGQIAEGKLADFAILQDDLFTTDPERIHQVKVDRTVIGGEPVYTA